MDTSTGGHTVILDTSSSQPVTCIEPVIIFAPIILGFSRVCVDMDAETLPMVRVRVDELDTERVLFASRA